MNVTEIIRAALRAGLDDAGATESDRRQAEELKERLADLMEQTRPRRPPLVCESGKALREAKMDQFWRSVEDDTFAELKDIFLNGINTLADYAAARTCVGLVFAEICLRKSQRLLDSLEGNENNASE